jgi:hypothetical protein
MKMIATAALDQTGALGRRLYHAATCSRVQPNEHAAGRVGDDAGRSSSNCIGQSGEGSYLSHRGRVGNHPHISPNAKSTGKKRFVNRYLNGNRGVDGGQEPVFEAVTSRRKRQEVPYPPVQCSAKRVRWARWRPGR